MGRVAGAAHIPEIHTGCGSTPPWRGRRQLGAGVTESAGELLAVRVRARETTGIRAVTAKASAQAVAGGRRRCQSVTC
jgi:hypothetical protein